MKILVTGGAGFLGSRLIDRILDQTVLSVDGVTQTVSSLMVIDLNTAGLSDHPKLNRIDGPVDRPDTLNAIREFEADVVVHLAAVVSSAAESHLALGLDVNVTGLVELLKTVANPDRPPLFILASSVAVFSCQANERISDTTPAAPSNSYGMQKLIGEQLVSDLSRRGEIRGRALRVPTISIRPGKPNAAASSFASSILREPLNGEPADLPVALGLGMHLASPQAATEHFVRAIGLNQTDLDGDTTLVLPGISVTVQQMLEALERAKPGASDLVRSSPDPRIQAIVNGWPRGIDTPRAQSLGFLPDPDIDFLIAHYVQG